MKCQVLVDWLTFSVKGFEPFEVIRTFLGMDPSLFQDAGFGLMGYTQDLFFSDIHVLYEPRENSFFHDMGVCVSMSGNGCRTFETMSKLTFDGAVDKQGTESIAFPVLFQLLASTEGVNVSRIDIACDDHAGYLDMDDILKKFQTNEINSRMTKRSTVISFDGTQRDGSTAYLGAPSSDFRVRIYDKALEQDTDSHWVRVELVMRGKNSNAFVEQITNYENVGKLAAQVINDKFSFIERDDANITRCTICDWWSRFVNELGSVRLVARKAIQHSVERIGGWVESQVGPSLAILFRTLGWPYLFQLAKDAGERLSDRQQTLITDYNSLRFAGGVV